MLPNCGALAPRQGKPVLGILRLAQFDAAALALSVLACGRTAADPVTLEPAGAPPTSDPQTPGTRDDDGTRPVDPADYAEACAATCKAHQPASPQSSDCHNASVGEQFCLMTRAAPLGASTRSLSAACTSCCTWKPACCPS